MRVLVADQDATLTEGARQALQAAGHEPMTAFDGPSAWQLAQERGFDAAFVAWDLPELDGLELCSLWQNEAALQGRPVVMMVQPPHLPQARAWAQLTAGQAPGWDVLAKPFAPGLMVDVLQAVAAP